MATAPEHIRRPDLSEFMPRAQEYRSPEALEWLAQVDKAAIDGWIWALPSFDEQVLRSLELR